MRLFISVVVIVLAAAGCKDEPNDPNEGLPAAQDWSAPQPAPSSARAHAGGNTNPHGGSNPGDPHAGMDMGGAGDPHAGMDMGGAGDPHAGMDMGDPRMAAVQAPDPNRKIDESRFLKGTIHTTDATKSVVKPGDIVFVSVKPIDATTGEVIGQAVAVEKLTVGTGPIEFHLTERNAMRAGTDFSGDVLVIAWVDRDGDAISKQPGDVSGEVRATIPAEGVMLKLDTILR